MSNYQTGDIISDEEELIRFIRPEWLREDLTVSPEAFRPRQRDMNDGVSVSLKKMMSVEEMLQTVFIKKHNCYAGLILSQVPHRRSYNVKYTSQAHCVINSDVIKLSTDEETLAILAEKCQIFYKP